VLVATRSPMGLSFVPLEYASSRTRDDGAVLGLVAVGLAAYLPEPSR
jgi:hypothetical protein